MSPQQPAPVGDTTALAAHLGPVGSSAATIPVLAGAGAPARTAPEQTDIVLDVRNLSIAYDSQSGPVLAVEDVSFTVHKGETFGLAGESGSGKSTIANAILQLLSGNGRIVAGSITCDGVDISSLRGESLRTFRWNTVAMVFQSAMNSLNPVMTIGDQIIDVFTTHRKMSRSRARQRAEQLLERVGIDRDRIDAYPHQLSGGMRQRAVIAIAVALEPPLLIMDEPTTALDVVIQQEIINEIKELQRQQNFALLFITHDLSLMVEISQRLGIMRNGRLLESGDAKAIYANPQHDYTRQLIQAFPPVTSRRHRVDPAGHPPDGDAAGSPIPDAEPGPARAGNAGDSEVVVSISGLTKVFRQGGLFSRQSNVAVDHVDLELRAGEITALVGESGSGKSTIARILARLEQPTSGRIVVAGIDVLAAEPKRASRRYRKTVQMVFQDPFGSLNPTKRVRHFLDRPLAIYSPELSAQQRDTAAAELLVSVELDPGMLDRYPHELSGGQRQRIAVARALAADPSVIVADEPTSMLDVSVRMGVLKLLQRLRDQRGICVLYITHDLASARFVADNTIVMLRGSLVEGGPSDHVMDAPGHPYTKLLVSAAPDPTRTEGFDKQRRLDARAEIRGITERRSNGKDRLPLHYITPDHWISVDGMEETVTRTHGKY